MKHSLYEKAKEYFLSCFFNRKVWISLKKEGHDYFNWLLENCPAETESDFNDWISGKTLSIQPKKDKTRRDVHCLYVMWLNKTYRERNKS